MGPSFNFNVKLNDLVSGPARRITATVHGMTAALVGSTKALNQSAQVAGQQGTRSFQNYSNQVRQNTAQLNANQKQHERLRITFLGMLRVMALFAINLQIIRAATSPFTFFKNSLSEARVFQEQMAQINVLLRVTPERLKLLGDELSSISTRFGIDSREVLVGAKEIASSVDSLVLGMLTESQAVSTIMAAAAKGAKLDGTDINEVANALRTTLAALQLPVSDVDRVLALLFATVDVGAITFKELSNQIGGFSGTLRAVLPKDAALAKQFTDEVFGMYAALTQVMPVAEAETAVNRFLISAGVKKSVQEQKLAAALSKATGVDITQEGLFRKGPLQYMKDIGSLIGQDSPLIGEIVSSGRDVSKMSDTDLQAALGATSAQVVGAVFKNVRALRPVLLLMQNDAELFDTVVTALQNSANNLDEAFEEATNNLNHQTNRFFKSIDRLQRSIAKPVIVEATAAVKDLADSVASVVDTRGFDELSASQKVSKVLNAITGALDRWLSSGGDRKVRHFTSEFINSILEGLLVAVEQSDKVVRLGTAIALGIIDGAKKVFTDSRFLNPLENPLVGGFIVSRFLGGNNRVLRGMGISTIGTGAIEGAKGGGDFSLMGTALQAALIASMFKSFGFGSARTAAAAGGMTSASAAAGAALSGPGVARGLRLRNAATAARGAAVSNQAARLGVSSSTVAGAFSLGSLLRDPRALAAAARTGFGVIARSPLMRFGGGALAALGLAEAGSRKFLDRGMMDVMFGFGGDEAAGFEQANALSGSNIGTLLNEFIGASSAATGGSRNQMLYGASSGAVLGAAAGVATGPFAPVAVPALALGGAVLGGSLGYIRSGGQRRQAAATSLGLERQVFDAFGVGDLAPQGILAPMLSAAKAAGITSSSDLSKFLAFNFGVILEESGFDPTAHGDRSLGGSGSYGLYQLYTGGGQGDAAMRRLGITDPNKLKDSVLNTAIGAGEIANVWGSISASDPNFFFKMAQQSGHPNASASGREGAGRIAAAATEFYRRALSAGTYTDIANQGVTPASGGNIVVQGDVVINTQNVADLENFIEQLARGVNSAR